MGWKCVCTISRSMEFCHVYTQNSKTTERRPLYDVVSRLNLDDSFFVYRLLRLTRTNQFAVYDQINALYFCTNTCVLNSYISGGYLALS